MITLSFGHRILNISLAWQRPLDSCLLQYHVTLLLCDEGGQKFMGISTTAIACVQVDFNPCNGDRSLIRVDSRRDAVRAKTMALVHRDLRFCRGFSSNVAIVAQD